jgi:hypothetical protein
MVKKQQWKDNRKRYPEGELLVDRDVRESVKDEKTRHRDQYRGRIIDIDGAHEIALLALEFQITIITIETHPERLFVQRSGSAARTLES